MSKPMKFGLINNTMPAFMRRLWEVADEPQTAEQSGCVDIAAERIIDRAKGEIDVEGENRSAGQRAYQQSFIDTINLGLRIGREARREADQQ